MPLLGLYKNLLNKLLAIYQWLEEDIFEEDFSINRQRAASSIILHKNN